MDVGKVKQVILEELQKTKRAAEAGKFDNVDLWWREGYLADFELKSVLREKLDSIGGITQALRELMNENKIEEWGQVYRVKDV